MLCFLPPLVHAWNPRKVQAIKKKETKWSDHSKDYNSQPALGHSTTHILLINQPTGPQRPTVIEALCFQPVNLARKQRFKRKIEMEENISVARCFTFTSFRAQCRANMLPTSPPAGGVFSEAVSFFVLIVSKPGKRWSETGDISTGSKGSV